MNFYILFQVKKNATANDMKRLLSGHKFLKWQMSNQRHAQSLKEHFELFFLIQ